MSWSAIGYGVFMLSQIAMIMIMTRLAPIEDIGRYGVALSIATIVLTFTNLNLRMGNVTDTTTLFSPGVYVATRILSTALAMAGIAVLSWFFGEDVRAFEIGLIIGVMKCAEAMCDLFYSNYQKAGRMALMARSLVLRGPIAILLFGIVLYLTRDIRIALVSQILVWWSVLLFHDVPQANRLFSLRPDFDFGQIRKLVRESMSLGIAGLLTAIATNAPRLVVAQFLGLTAAGIFTSVAYILQVGTVFATSVTRAIAHRLATLFQAGNSVHYRRLIAKVSGAMGALGVGLFVLALLGGQTILTLAFGAKFADQKTLFALLCMVLSFRLVIAVLQTGLLAQREFVRFARHRFWVAALMVGGCSAGALIWGMIGVGAALLLVSLYQILTLYVLLGQHHPRQSGKEG